MELQSAELKRTELQLIRQIESIQEERFVAILLVLKLFENVSGLPFFEPQTFFPSVTA